MLFTIAFIFFLLGAILASFVGVIAERVYTGQSWLRSRSRCNSCRRQLQALDLIPIVSWCVWRGRCRTCRAQVPFVYMFSELVLGALFASSYIVLGLTLLCGVFCAFLVTLFFIVLYDMRHTIVPIPSSVLLVILAIIFSFVSSASLPNFLSLFLFSFVPALGIAFFFFLMFALSRGRAMGLGDAPVAFALSLVVGSQHLFLPLAGLLFSFWIGGLIGVFILVLRRRGLTISSEVPFVPFLAAGYLLAFFTQWNPLPF